MTGTNHHLPVQSKKTPQARPQLAGIPAGKITPAPAPAEKNVAAEKYPRRFIIQANAAGSVAGQMQNPEGAYTIPLGKKSPRRRKVPVKTKHTVRQRRAAGERPPGPRPGAQTIPVLPVQGDFRFRVPGRQNGKGRDMIKVPVGEQKIPGIEIQSPNPCYDVFGIIPGIDDRAGPPPPLGGKGIDPAVRLQRAHSHRFDGIPHNGGIIPCGALIC
jgi:hypothetical protein